MSLAASPTLFTFQKRLATTMEMSRAEFAEQGNNPQLKEEDEEAGGGGGWGGVDDFL